MLSRFLRPVSKAARSSSRHVAFTASKAVTAACSAASSTNSATSSSNSVWAVAGARSMSHKPALVGEVADMFGDHSFNERAQKKYLPPKVYKEMRATIAEGKVVSVELADRFAEGLVRWAQERGVTHFAHWFQPLTNYFAYKHDSLIEYEGNHIVTTLTGKQLIQAEPDGSSFPSGGLRNTHTARGHTVWDPTTPCFIADHGTGTTLCIPSIFFSWTGYALDEKTPLLRSTEMLNRDVLGLLRAAGDKSHKSAFSNSGIEQEFFIIDEEHYMKRPDLMQTGRTLLGADPPKGQCLDDQYFGNFSDRMLRMMNDAEVAMWKLGIPQTTRHREVAPGQYEMAPIYAPCSMSSDYNLMQMDVLTRTAHAHGLAVLFHEKPFANVNGSGKHNNWSVSTDKLASLFIPGPVPEDNVPFLLTLTAVIRAMHLHPDVLRYASSGAGNDHRLGGHEAPPAIISAYLGEDLTDGVLRFIGEQPPARVKPLELGVKCLPAYSLDPTDRNRTSPVAFTGNKFEFRAVGSSHNPGRSSTCFNVIVCESMRYLTERIEEATAGKKLSKAELTETVKDILRETIKKHRAILFDGDNYSEDWLVEAKARGLPNYKTSPEAYAAFDNEKNIKLFEGVLNEPELKARIDVAREEYITRVSIEAKSFLQLAQTAVLPPAYDAQKEVASSIIAAREASEDRAVCETQLGYLNEVAGHVSGLVQATKDLKAALAEADGIEDLQAKAEFHCNSVLPIMLEGREHADALELMVESSAWTLPTYHEMLFHQF